SSRVFAMARCAIVIFLLLPCLTAGHQRYRHAEQSYALECRVNDPLSCPQSKGEVCVFAEGRYRCECPHGINRLGDGRCMLINECAKPSTHSCHKNARCIDQTEGYTCECNEGFSDVSSDRVNKAGRICQRTTNECSQRQTYGVDCDENASCVDTPDGFSCVCQPGYTDISSAISKNPGRKCVPVVNECTDGSADCSSDAVCMDRADGYECRCRPGFVDASPQVDKYPGRVCNRPHEASYYGLREPPTPNCRDSSTCAANEECKGGECHCVRGAQREANGVCKVFSHCERGGNECDKNAICSNTYNGISCTCKAGFKDVSPDPMNLPGRKCSALVNECAEDTADCSPLSKCEDLPDGYMCRCNAGTTDVSSRYGLKPGRRCSEGDKACSDKSLNSCDENADCVQLPDGYTCKCFAGYVDVSSNAMLSPGRVCTLHTSCPAQPTDLVFLVDGSGSIGSYVFQNEVLRFLSEFTELFDISPTKTRVSVVQYSDQIRHEFSLGDYGNSRNVHDAIRNIEYLTGLTRTGAAIEHVVNEAFSTSRGARPQSDEVSRVCIVITDGRSQDNVTIPSNNGRMKHIQMFAVGVTNHVLDSELEQIAGDKSRTFHVNAFEDLNTRLRSLIQKEACPHDTPTPYTGPCDPSTHNGCDRSLNQVCIVKDGRFSCGCPKGFEIHPVTQVCGGDICNPEIASSCPYPEVCEKTPFGNWRCSCAEGYRDPKTGACKPHPFTEEQKDACDPSNPHSCGPNSICEKSPSGEAICKCNAGYVLESKSDKCLAPGSCDPNSPDACDLRKREKCLPTREGTFTCQCEVNYKRHPVTEICLIDECAAGMHDCDVNAVCTDTDESYLCACKPGFVDKSPDARFKPGRVCSAQRNECMDGSHNCSTNAMCIDLVEGYLCRCKDDFVDVSPNPSHFGGIDCRPLINECATKEANTCHENALCIDTRDSYKCQCKEGFVDRDELTNPGRNCQKLNSLCDSGKNTCSKNARCIERGASDYECVCLAGFLDMDSSRPGRHCVERICLDPSKHDCHAAATCTEIDGPEKYKCACRDGYIDKNPSKPGRECRELVNECFDSSLNECDPLATCIDMDDGYTCSCPLGTKDISTDKSKPGRHCFALVNECHNPHLNNCSRFADCIDKEDGYDCKCKTEYHDETPSTPGINCKFILNECASPNLNDCSKHAECIDTKEGYECKCKNPYKDERPDKPGRLCTFNECASPSTNDCHKDAICLDTDDGFMCTCKEGFYDESSDGNKAGRKCTALKQNEPMAEPTTIDPNRFPCRKNLCRKNLGEVCVGGSKCSCRPGEGRANPTDKCEPVVEVPIVVRVNERDKEHLQFSSDYGNPTSASYVEVMDGFVKGVGDTLKKTEISPKYIASEINYITNPKVENSTWNDGLLINGTILLKQDEDVCKVFKDFAEQAQRQGGKIGNLQLADDFTLLDPCKTYTQVGEPCGSSFCRSELGEECIAGRLCGCPKGQKRAGPDEPCRVVESWSIPLVVVRDGEKKIDYSPNLANPHDSTHKTLVSRFEDGVGESYRKTKLKPNFVSAEVNDLSQPSRVNGSWDEGVLYNFTANFVRGSVAEPRTVWSELIDYIMKKNKFEVGTSKLFISPNQMNPFSACSKSDCHTNAICTEDGRGAYTCACPADYRDMNPTKPGRECLSIRGTNECERPELNECSPDARCIDLEYLYKCECIAPFVNSAGPGKIPGSECTLDYCSDVNFCPANSTCKNFQEQAQCSCNPGFVDVRKAPRIAEAKLGDAICLRTIDVDECALGLHNCSAAAICTDKKIGYDCRCPEGYTDGNPSEPGRVCAALLCGMCNGHGDCIHDAATHNVTCTCVEGWTGEFCEVAPSKLPLILMLLLALLFLLLALLCCVALCARCRCFGGRTSTASGSGQEILGSDYYTIPRAKLKAGGYGDAGAFDDGASISSGGSMEEVERRVTTDVTTREIRTTTYTDEDGNTHVSQQQFVTAGPMSEAMARSASSGRALEQEVDHFAMTSSDHYAHAIAGGASTAAHNAAYDSDDDENRGDATFDRKTRVTQSHDFQPGFDSRTGTERRRNEMTTTTNSNEVNYF
ncbi:hypothetical protein PFISCL1PPCAC_10655, partial [Pristionchus fissidentatus]